MTLPEWFAIATCFLFMATFALHRIDTKTKQREVDLYKQRCAKYRLDMDEWRRNGCKGPRPVKPEFKSVQS